MRTRNTRGAHKHSQNGNAVPLWMLCTHSLDSLNFAKVNRLDYLKQKRILVGGKTR